MSIILILYLVSGMDHFLPRTLSHQYSSHRNSLRRSGSSNICTWVEESCKLSQKSYRFSALKVLQQTSYLNFHFSISYLLSSTFNPPAILSQTTCLLSQILVKLLMVQSPLQSAYPPNDTDNSLQNMSILGGETTQIDKDNNSHGIVFQWPQMHQRKTRRGEKWKELIKIPTVFQFYFSKHVTYDQCLPSYRCLSKVWCSNNALFTG